MTADEAAACIAALGRRTISPLEAQRLFPAAMADIHRQMEGVRHTDSRPTVRALSTLVVRSTKYDTPTLLLLAETDFADSDLLLFEALIVLDEVPPELSR